MESKETLEQMAQRGDVAELVQRIHAAEDVIDVANGPESTAQRMVEAIDAYEAKYGEVKATYVQPWPGE
jgi:hypothetical protein